MGFDKNSPSLYYQWIKRLLIYLQAHSFISYSSRFLYSHTKSKEKSEYKGSVYTDIFTARLTSPFSLEDLYLEPHIRYTWYCNSDFDTSMQRTMLFKTHVHDRLKSLSADLLSKLNRPETLDWAINIYLWYSIKNHTLKPYINWKVKTLSKIRLC